MKRLIRGIMKDDRLEKNKLAFYSQLENMFAGKDLKNFKGKSGFSNLLSIKAKYFENIKQTLENKISKTFKSSNTQNELYEKAITFFDSYLNETGCPYFNKTEFYKNLYEKVYTNTNDTALFYKTSKLYYVKSDSVPSDAQFDIKNENEETPRAKIKFDCERLVYTSTNEKKELRFILKDLNKKDKTITLLVVYKDQKIDLGDDYSFELNSKKDEDSFELTSNNKQNLDKFHELLINYELDIKSSEVAESIAIYKKQKEIDFFIHKDAKSFLEEQFNIYLYNYLFKDSEIEFNKWNIERLEQIKAIKTTIFETIELISKFENELRAIWLKPKFVRKSRYIISLKTLKKLLEKDVYKEVLNSVIQNLSNMEYYNDLVFSIKDIYKKPLEKIYIDKIEFVNNEFKFSSVKVFSDEKKFNEYLEKNENEKQCNSIIYDRDNTIDGFYASYTKNNIVNTLSIEDMYIDTKYFTEEFTNKLLEAISKNNNIEECIDGTLIKSDNFQALNTILSKYKESINLVYIDPPFNTGADFAYKDKFRDSTWLTLLENRLDYIKKLLHIDGSLYLHLDHNCNYIARQLLEEKFPNTFRREIIWNTSPSPSGFKTKALNFVRQHDTIFYMANSENPTFNKLYRTQEEDKSIGWLDPILENEQLFIEKYVDGELKKEPIGEVSTLAIGDVWNDIYSMMFTQNMTRENWSEQNTQKPENLLRRIIQTSSNKGDTILDFFAGSGTTLVSAHKLKRKWIGVEMGEFIEKITLKRLKTVLVGDIKPKLTQDLNWNGGGFIKYYELESYEDVLSQAHYSLNKETLIDLYQSEKLANDNVINKNSNIKLNIDEIYNDIDIFETISNITGFRIKKIHEEKCIFLDKDKEILIDKNNLNFSDYPFLRQLIWWK